MTPMIVEHPLLQHKLSILRNKQTGTKEFRDLVGEIATLLCYALCARAAPHWRQNLLFAVFLYPQPHVHAPFWLTPTVGATLGAAACVLAWSDDVSASASATFSFSLRWRCACC